jgi:hypothetical protein
MPTKTKKEKMKEKLKGVKSAYKSAGTTKKKIVKAVDKIVKGGKK